MSDTSKTRARRQRKHARAGQGRKKKLAREGTTPAFPIHPDGDKKSSSAKK